MAAKLNEDLTKATMRLRTADLELIRALYPGQGDALFRAILTAYCDRLRAKGLTGVNA